MIPLVMWICYPAVIMIYLIGLKLFFSNHYWYTEEINLIWIIFVCFDLMIYFVDIFRQFHVCFPYVKPLKILSLALDLIKYIVSMLIGPIKSAANGTLDIAKLIIGKIIEASSSALQALSKIVEQVGYIVYNGIKAILNKILRGSKMTFDFLMIPIKGISSLYFQIFKFLLVALRQLGIVGEFIFTIFGLFWLLWPLFIGYKLGRTEFYIPAVVLTIILIVQGRKVIISNQ